HLVVKPAVLRELFAERAQVLEDARLAVVDALAGDLDGAVLREQVRGLRPEAFLYVEAVDSLQVLDLVLVLEELEVMKQRGRALPQRLGRIVRFGGRSGFGRGAVGRRQRDRI